MGSAFDQPSLDSLRHYVWLHISPPRCLFGAPNWDICAEVILDQHAASAKEVGKTISGVVYSGRGNRRSENQTVLFPVRRVSKIQDLQHGLDALADSCFIKVEILFCPVGPLFCYRSVRHLPGSTQHGPMKMVRIAFGAIFDEMRFHFSNVLLRPLFQHLHLSLYAHPKGRLCSCEGLHPGNGKSNCIAWVVLRPMHLTWPNH